MADEHQDPETYFKEKKAMTISEVAILLDQYTATTRARDPDHQPNLLVTKTLEYTQAFAASKNRDSVQKIRNMLAAAGLSDQELALVCNLQIGKAEEARKLVPSLESQERYTDEELNRLLAEVQQYAEFE